MIDIGANLAGDAFAKDLPAVLARATEHGVKKIIVTGSSVTDSEAALALAQAHPGVLYATAGIHPHAASQFESGSIAQLAQMLTHTAVVAIGETGLDFNRNYSSSDNQMQSFEAHLQLAHQVDKPLFLHERDAFEPFYELMREHSALGERAVLHCFTGNRKALKCYLDLGMYIGITGWICDRKRGAELREIINYAPLERLMIETDAPYLTPHREQLKQQLAHKNRNEPWTLKHTAAALAAALNIDVTPLQRATSANAERFFRL